MKNLLCFMGRHWFNDLLLRWIPKYGYHAYVQSQNPPVLDERLWYDLPLDDQTPPAAVLVDNTFWNACLRRHGEDVIRGLIRRASHHGAVPVVAIDHGDVILSKFRSSDVDEFDLVLKAHGLPRDRELMNWQIGVRWGLNRCQKLKKISNPEWIYSTQQLEKFKISFDLGTAYCDRLLQPLPGIFEPVDVFFVAAFNSMNRLNGLEICKRRFKTAGHLVRLDPEHPIVGLGEGEQQMAWSKKEVLEFRRGESTALYDKYRPLFGQTVPKWLFRLQSMCSKIMPAFSGIGELGSRHYQALAFGKVLVCEDLSYIETHFPFLDGETCIFVSDHLEDLHEKIQHLLDDPARRRRIARSGFEQFRSCYQEGSNLFHQCFVRYLDLRSVSETRI